MTRLVKFRTLAAPVLSTAIVVAAACPAAAQPAFPGFDYEATGVYLDNDDNGIVSCGDHVEFRARIGFAEGAPFPVLDGEFGAVMLSNGRVVVGSVVAVSEHPAGGPVVVTEGNSSGDVEVRVDLGTVCPPGHCPPPAGELDGATVTFYVEIIRPNNRQFLTVPGFARGSNYAQSSNQPGVAYEPCDPPTGPGEVDLFVTKDDGGVVAPAGSVVAYELSFGNQGSLEATGVVVSDTVPAHAVFDAAGSAAGWSCADGAPAGTACTFPAVDLPPGSATSSTFAVRIDATLPAGADQISNTATIADDGDHGPDADPEDNASTDTTPLVAAPDLAVSKSDGGVSVAPGEVVAYEIDYSNLGNQAATGAALAEVVPENASFDALGSSPGWSCADGAPAGTACIRALGPLAAGESGSATFAVRVEAALPPGTDQIVNTVTIGDDGANGPDPDPSNDTATDTTPIEGALDLFVVKDDGGIAAAPGDTVTYTVLYGNAGSRGASGVAVTDAVPDHAVFDGPGSSPRWSCSDGDPAGTLCSLDVGSLGPGESAQVEFAVRVAPALPAGVDRIVNRAVIADDGRNGPDLDPSDNASTDTTPLEAAPDLSVVKDDGGIRVEPGSPVSYALAYANSGNQGATGVLLSDRVPEHTVFDGGASSPGWSCTDGAPPGTECTLPVGGLAAGGSGSVEFAVRVDSPVPAGVDRVVNTVTVGDDGTNGPDLDPGDNSSTEVTPVVPPPPPPPPPPGSPLLDAFKADQPDRLPAEPGDAITYTVAIVNAAESTAAAAEFQSGAPEHTTLVVGTVSTTHGVIAEGNQPGDTAVSVVLGDLPAGDEAVITFQVVIDAELPPAVDEIVCQGTVGADGLEPVLTDDPDTPEVDDPTRTLLTAGGGSVPVDIPAAGPLGLAGLAVLLVVFALRRLRPVGA